MHFSTQGLLWEVLQAQDGSCFNTHCPPHAQDLVKFSKVPSGIPCQGQAVLGTRSNS